MSSQMEVDLLCSPALLLTNLRSSTVQSFEKFPRLFLLCILLYAIRFTLQSATRCYSPRISWIFKSPRGLNCRTRAFISRDLCMSAVFPETFERDIVQKFICTLDRLELFGDHAAIRNEQPYKICIELGPSRLRSSTCCYLKFTLDFV